jgi:hypothetical protein
MQVIAEEVAAPSAVEPFGNVSSEEEERIVQARAFREMCINAREGVECSLERAGQLLSAAEARGKDE